jgi:hypothetical protein
MQRLSFRTLASYAAFCLIQTKFKLVPFVPRSKPRPTFSAHFRRRSSSCDRSAYLHVTSLHAWPIRNVFKSQGTRAFLNPKPYGRKRDLERHLIERENGLWETIYFTLREPISGDRARP